MHNSFFIRDLLGRMNAHPLARERRNPHRTAAFDPAAKPGRHDMVLSDKWRIACKVDPNTDPLVVTDLADFLPRMNVRVSDTAGQAIAFTRDDALAERDCRIEVNPTEVTVYAGGIAGAWAGVAWLEFEMQSKRGPFLPLGIAKRFAAWPVQVTQGPWCANYSVPDFDTEYLDDDSFRLYAHYGVNSMMIYGDVLCYADGRILPELNHIDARRHFTSLAGAAKRAAKYGIRFTYLAVGPKLRHDHPVFLAHPGIRGAGYDRDGNRIHFLCGSNPKVESFYEELYKNLFSKVPELAGVVLIVAQESWYHCQMWPWAKYRCPVCDAMETEDVIVRTVAPVQRGIAAAGSSAFTAVWAYTWSNSYSHPSRDELIRRLPKGVHVFHHVEKDEIYRKPTYSKSIWDYSVDYTGVADITARVRRVADETGREMMVKTETGTGLELFQYPYVPAMQRLVRKWQCVRSLAPVGVHQAWLFFGMFNTRAEALGLWAAYAPEMEGSEFLRRLAMRDFGPDAVDSVLASWRYMSRAVGHLPVVLVNVYYVGPSFLGPCHPLLPKKGMQVPGVFHANLFYLQEGGETFSRRNYESCRTCLAIDDINPTHGLPVPAPGETRDGLQILLDEYRIATELSQRALQFLQEAEQLVKTKTDRQNLAEERGLTEMICRTLRACANTTSFIVARDKGDTVAMKRIAADERDNASGAVSLYRDLPWLEFNMRIDGVYSPAADMIAEKLRIIDAFLAE